MNFCAQKTQLNIQRRKEHATCTDTMCSVQERTKWATLVRVSNINQNNKTEELHK